MAISQPVICPDFIGRAGQVALFHRLTGEIADGSPSIFRVAMIRGEAGIGKTRFVQEVTSSTRQADSIILRSRCSEQDHAQPHGLIIDLLNTFCLEHTKEQIENSIRPVAPALARIFPQISIYCPDISPSQRLDPEYEKQRIFQATVQFLLHVESSAPHARHLVLVMDDLH